VRVYSTLGALSQLPIKHSQVGTVRLIFIYPPTRTGVALLSQKVNPLIIKPPSSLTLDNRFAQPIKLR